MANIIDKSMNTPSPKTHKSFVVTQFFLRVLALATTLAAALIMITNKETSITYGFVTDARYTYSTAFKFFVFANLIACVFSCLSIFVALIIGTKAVFPIYYYYIFLHDLVIGTLLMAGCSAATAIGYVGKYGNSHSLWLPICKDFAKFCNKNVFAILLSYVGFLLYLVLIIVSVNKSRQIQV